MIASTEDTIRELISVTKDTIVMAQAARIDAKGFVILLADHSMAIVETEDQFRLGRVIDRRIARYDSEGAAALVAQRWNEKAKESEVPMMVVVVKYTDALDGFIAAQDAMVAGLVERLPE